MSVSLVPKRVTDTMDSAADKLQTVASDTKRAVTVTAVIACAALIIGTVALVVSVVK